MQITTLEYKQCVDMNTFKRTLQDVATVINPSRTGFQVIDWSDGYCEQWGHISHTSASFTVNLLKTYKDTFTIFLLQEPSIRQGIIMMSKLGIH